MKYFNEIFIKILLSLSLINILLISGISSQNDDDENLKDYPKSDEDKYPRLLQFFPKDPNSAYTLNEKSTFTNSLSTGWIVKAKTRVNMLLYILVDETLRSLNDINFGYVYFTAKSSDCDLNLNKEDEDEEFTSREIPDYDYQEELEKKKKQKLTFKLKFLDSPKSKFSSSGNDQTTGKNITLIAAETSIKLEYSSEKYFVCLNFASKNATNRYFLHQGNKSLSFKKKKKYS